jgi:cysteine desulfuration protein SufE
MPSASILQVQARLVEEFEALPDWQARYKLIIDYARTLAPLPDAYRTEANQVRGCASTVWLHAHSDGRLVHYLADSDAVIVRGLIALLLHVYSEHTPQEILDAPPAFIEELGLNTQLTTNRANGLSAMVRQLMAYALAFKSQSASG